MEPELLTLDEPRESGHVPVEQRRRLARMAACEFNERERERIPAQVPMPGTRPRGIEVRKRDPCKEFGELARHTADATTDENVPGTLDAADDTRNVERLEELEEPRTN